MKAKLEEEGWLSNDNPKVATHGLTILC